MAQADRSKIIGLFDTPVDNTFNVNTRKIKSNGKPNIRTRKQDMLEKLEIEDFGSFTEKDWYQYFVYQAEKNGVSYLTGNFAKEYAIIRSVLTQLSWVDLKLMIDFVWEANHDLVQDKRTLGVYILSKGWINTVYQQALMWRDGTYKSKNAPLHNREWVVEASKKKQDAEQDDWQPKKKKKRTIKRKKPQSKVKIGW